MIGGISAVGADPQLHPTIRNLEPVFTGPMEQ